MSNSEFHYFKKSLGQNFLKSKASVRDLLSAAKLESNDLVIEIGPGQGALTEELVKLTNKIILIEKDVNLIDYLTPKYPQAQIINADFLEVDLSKLTDGKSYKVVGSLPYNVSKKIIRLLLTAQNPPEIISLIIQKEVAKQYSAKPPKANLLSNFAVIYSDVNLGKVIDARSFFPIPKVDGQIIIFKNIRPKVVSPEKLWSFVRTGFSSPRKILAGNLRAYDKTRVQETLQEMDLSLTIRAGELTLENWIELARKFNH